MWLWHLLLPLGLSHSGTVRPLNPPAARLACRDSFQGFSRDQRPWLLRLSGSEGSGGAREPCRACRGRWAGPVTR